MTVNKPANNPPSFPFNKIPIQTAIKFLVDSGMQFDPISPEVRAVLREKTKAVIDQVKAKVGDELVNAVLAEIAK